MKNGMGGAWVEENNKRRPSLDNCKLEPERHGKANRGKLTNNRSNYTRSITIIKLQQIGNNFRRAVWGLRDIREERPETLRIQTNNRYSLSRRKNALRSRWSCKNARICGTRTCGGAPITAPIQPEPIEIECVTYLIHQTLVIVPQNRPAKSARKIGPQNRPSTSVRRDDDGAPTTTGKRATFPIFSRCLLLLLFCFFSNRVHSAPQSIIIETLIMTKKMITIIMIIII